MNRSRRVVSALAATAVASALGIVVIPAAVGDGPVNHLDADSAGTERSAGQWTGWYSATTTRSTEQAKTGAASLKVVVHSAGSGSWGATSNNWPGFVATAGNKRASFWAMKGTGSVPNVTLRLHWRNGSGADLAVDNVSVTPLAAWQQAAADVVAPAGTAYVKPELIGTSAAAGATAYFDELFVGERSSTSSPTSNSSPSPSPSPSPSRSPSPSPSPAPSPPVTSLPSTTSTPTSVASVTAPEAIVAPTAPPVRVCGNSAILAGPSSPPTGAVTVAASQDLNTLTQAHPAGTTFWLAPGTHRLGTSVNAQVITKTGNSYIGAPGAVVDGQGVNSYAFTSGWPTQATDVTIKHLTVQNFQVPRNGGAVNPGSAARWVVERNTLARNSGGHALYIGSNNVVRYNCIAANGQGGFGTYRPGGGVSNLTVTHNEITGNNTEDWESRIPGCGCTAGGKFWEVKGAVVTDNWVHDNRSSGLWADVNNIDFLFERNLIENNDAEGIFYEVSYNGVIRHNTLRRNGLVKGRTFEARSDNFPVGAIYVSESGGDARLPGSKTLDIHSNLFSDNWSGVVLYEGANRFCGSPVHPGTTCTPFAGRNTQCVAGTIDSEPHYSNCRWKTQNVKVHHNIFELNKSAIGCSTTYCGRQGLISDSGSYPSWSPYRGNVIKDRITFASGNVFSDNAYVGSWRFTPYDTSRDLDLAAWRSAPYNQDARSAVFTTRPPLTPVPTTPAPAATPTGAPTSGVAGVTVRSPGTSTATTTSTPSVVTSATLVRNIPRPPSLVRSTSGKRSSPTALSRRVVRGNTYVFVKPGTTPIATVRFWLDNRLMKRAPRRTDRAAPYDFVGGTSTTARAWNTRRVKNGRHTITAVITFKNGKTKKVEATFIVRNRLG